MTELAPGTRILERYVVGAFLGAGGMAAVYQAVDERTGREAAVKVMLHAFEPSLVRRFEAEALALSKVTHPNVVELFAFGATPLGVPCMVMEKLVGIDLEKHLELAPNARLLEREAIAIALDVLDGLDAIHSAGIVHRDIKPSNVFLGDVGGTRRVKLLDFGIAKTESAPKLTRTGNSVGTPAYMAAEQILGKPTAIGTHTDLFQVGMVLFEMLTGTMAFPCEQMTELILRCTQPPARIDSKGLGLSAEYESVFARVLSSRVELRPPSALDFAASLNARRMGRQTPAWEASPAPAVGRATTSAPAPPAFTSEPPDGPRVDDADADAAPPTGLRGIAARLPASRLARTEERRWIASQLPPGARSFRIGSEIMVIVGRLTPVEVEALSAQLVTRFGSGVVVATDEMPPGFSISLAQLSGAGNLPEALVALVGRVL